ncbi:MAG: hypothetical protein DMG38_15975 [Acidobacteria bacterium]|nr:MAG: hypothetical protein DMG38_15975 [Acidobacteriota bacterium]
MSGRLLVNFNLDSLYCLVRIGFPPHILQAVQSAKDGLVQRFCVNFDAVFGMWLSFNRTMHLLMDMMNSKVEIR